MKLHNKVMLCCIGILVIVMCSIFLRFFTTQILVKKLNMDNVITQVVLFDNDDLRNANRKSEEKGIKIDWVKEYPFYDNDNKYDNKQDNKKRNYVGNIIGKIQSAEKKVSEWTGKHLLMYNDIVSIGIAYNKCLDWNLTAYTEYNGVIEIQDGQLAVFCNREDMTDKVNNVIDLARFCNDNNIEFLYVSAPSKISRNDNTYKDLDFSNENADEFLSNLKLSSVQYIDIRDNVEEERLVLHKLFFRTDHHWLPETGLWATGIIAKYLNENNIIQSDISLLKPETYNKDVYKDWFLGSRGKKITLSRTTPDDISVFHPNFYTQFKYTVPQYELDTIGDFNVMYDQEPIKEMDYYNKNPYGTYNYGDAQYIHIENLLADNEKKILVIKNSFANVVTPFLATQCKELDILDIRHFDGSVHSFILKHKPDIVIVLYHIENLNGKIEYKEHKNMWDFR